MDDAGGGQEVRKEGAGIRVLLHDLDGDAAAKEPLGKVKGDATAAAEDDPADLPGGDAKVFQHPGEIVRGRGDEEAVALLQDEAAVRRYGHAPAKDGADQDPALDEVVELVEGDALEAASLRHLQLRDLHPAPGEGLPLEEAWVFQQPVDLGGGLLVRIHGEGEGEGLPHLIDLVGVVGVADAGDGVDVLIQPVGAEAAEEVDLILAGGGDEEVRVGNAGLAQDLHRGAVALDGHHVETLQSALQHLLLGVDEGQVVALAGQLPGHGGAHLAGARDEDLHRGLLSGAEAPFQRDFLESCFNDEIS